MLAFNVLDADPKFSMELAGDTIADSPVSSSFISYLSQLRAKDPSLAKELFTKALSPALASQQWARSVGNLALYALPGFGDARMRAGMGLDDAANTDRTSGDALLKGVCQKVSDLLKAPEKTSPSLAGLNAVILLRLHPYFKNQLTSCAETVHAAADEMMRLAPNDQMREQITKSARSQSKDDLLSSASTTGSKAEQDQLYLRALLQLISRREMGRGPRYVSVT